MPLKFIDEIKEILINDAFEYIEIMESIDHNMLGYLYGSLKYWDSIIPKIYYDIFKKTKILECFSFWSGFLSEGGKLPYIICNKIPDYFNKIDSIKKDKLLYAVIPIGSYSDEINIIINSSLKTLTQNNKIQKIYCIYDSKLNNTLSMNNNKKIDFVEVTIPGPAYARNLGIQLGLEKGFTDVLLLDSDIFLKTDELDHFLNEYENNMYHIACPKIVSKGNDWFDLYHDFNGTLNGRYYNETEKQLLFGTTSFMCISHNVFDSGIFFATDFNEAAGEDIDFCLRSLLQGFQINPVDDVSGYHWYGYGNNELKNVEIFKKRFERYGRGEFKLLKRHPYYYSFLQKSVIRQS